jgi:transposase
MTDIEVYIGVDVSKDTLDIFNPSDSSYSKIKNRRSAALGYIRKIKARHPTAMICCESTGGYERTLMDACHEEGQPFCVMNAQQVRYYAKHLGFLEKNDKVDARIISKAANDKKPSPYVHPTPEQRERKELWTLRATLIVARNAVSNQMEHLKGKNNVAAVKRLVKAYDKEIEKLEGLCLEFVKKDERDASLMERLEEVQGVGGLTSIGVITLLPELYTMNDKKLAKLTGVAPLCDQSGQSDGARHIQQGRTLVRHVLYMAALSASRHNDILSKYYKKMVNAGKPKKVALVAVMHKLLRLFRRIAQDPGFKPVMST